LALQGKRGIRLDHARGRGRDEDVSVLDGVLLVRRGGRRLGAGREAREQRNRGGLPLDPPLCCRSPGSPPPVTFWNRWRNCCCACTSEALGSTSTVSRSVTPLVTST